MIPYSGFTPGWFVISTYNWRLPTANSSSLSRTTALEAVSTGYRQGFSDRRFDFVVPRTAFSIQFQPTLHGELWINEYMAMEAWSIQFQPVLHDEL